MNWVLISGYVNYFPHINKKDLGMVWGFFLLPFKNNMDQQHVRLSWIKITVWVFSMVIGCLTPVSDLSVLCWTPSSKIHAVIISLSSVFHTCVCFISLAHCHHGGVPVNDVQEEVGRVVVGLTLVACRDSRTRPERWRCDQPEAVHSHRACWAACATGLRIILFGKVPQDGVQPSA